MNGMINKSLTLALLFIFFLNYSLLSGAIGTWHNYTYSDNSNDIASDSQYIWCTTTGGLLRYDLTSGENRKYLNSDGLGDINILSIEIDSSGAIFLGGSNGTITKINPAGDIRIYEFEYTSDMRYNILDMEADGDILWVAAEIGIGKFLIYRNGGEFKDIAARLGDLPLETPVRAVRVIGNYLWVGTDVGLAFINKNNDYPQYPQNWRSYIEGQDGLTDARIYSIASIADTVFAGSYNGVFMFGPDSTWQNIGPPSRIIYSLERLNDGLTAATNNGIFQRIEGNWEPIPNDSLMTTNSRGIAEDDQGNIWAAFSKGGFAVYNGNYWEVNTVPGPALSFISDIAVDSSRNIWLVHAVPGFSSHEGVSRFDGVNWENFNYYNSGLGGSGAYAVEYDVHHDLIWFGSWGGGLFSFDDDTTWVNFDETNSPLAGLSINSEYIPVNDVAIDSRGCVWALEITADNPSVAMVVHNPDDSTWAAYMENPDQIADHFQHEICVVDNDIYIGGTNIHHLNFGQNSTDTTDDQWSDEPLVFTAGGEVNTLTMDNEGKLFIGSSSGLSYYDFLYGDTVMVELPDGYRSAVNSITIDGLGNKWIGSDSGVVVLSSAVEFGQLNWIGAFKSSNSYLLSNTVKKIVIDKSTGIVYIATISGLSVYESSFAAPSADLSDVAVYPNPVEGDERIDFLRVPSDAEIFIYTAAGELIKRFYYYEANSWDLRNKNNNKVAAGIYFFHVRSKDKSGSGKFAVIR